MPLHNYKRIRGSKIAAILAEIISTHTEMKGAWHFSPPYRASARRRYEEDRTRAVAFVYQGMRYEVDQHCVCSAKNIYYKLTVRVDGERKDIRAIKALIG